MNIKLLFILFSVTLLLWGGRCVQAQEHLPARGDSLVKEKKFDEALKLYQKALRADTGNSVILEKISKAKELKRQAAENYQEALLKGQQYLSAKEYKKAIEAFKTALDHKPGATYPQLKLDEIRQKYEDPQEKLQYKQYVQKADSLMEYFNYEKALTFYNKALEIKPRQVDLLKKTKQLNNFIKKQDQRGKNYDKIIAQAEELFDNQQYQQAMSKYQQASVIKPDKKLPGQKIQAIRKQLQKEEQKNKLYQNIVDTADSLYMERQFEKAKTAYKEALSIKPSESYPVNMIGKIDPALAQKQEVQNEYRQLINQGDIAFRNENYQDATSLYQEASQKKPSKNYPKDQIAKINELEEKIAIRNNRDQAYSELLAQADSMMQTNKIREARQAYRKALEIYSEKTYPKEQLQIISERLQQLNNQMAAYETYLSTADSLFRKESWQQAKSSYQEALAVFSDSTYPKKQISKAEVRLASAEERKQRYISAVARGDSLMNLDLPEKAKAAYEKALALDESKEYPKSQLSKLNQLIKEQNKIQSTYKENIALADSLYKNSKLEKAKEQYNEALTMLPEKEYPKVQIEKINNAIVKQEEQEKNYSRLTSQGDSLFKMEKYQSAKEYYSEALAAWQEGSHARKQLSKIERIVNKREQKLAQYDSLISQGDDLVAEKQYNQALAAFGKASELYPAKEYPTGQIDEIKKLLADIEQRKQAYNETISRADSLYEAEKYNEAISDYQNALNYTGNKSYPESQIAQSREMIAARKAKEKKYQAAISTADSLYQEKIYAEAREHYKKALEIKTKDSYAQDQLANIEEALNTYNSALSRGDRNYKNEEYEAALQQYQEAAQIKPGEDTLTNKISDTKQILKEIHRKMMEKYNKVIADADEKYKNKKFSEAIDAYEEAARINDEADYPEKKISQINKYLKEHSLREVITQNTTIADGTEKQFSFDPLGYRDRSQNFIVIKATGVNNKSPKVFLNYGQGNSKNGGVVIPSVGASKTKQYIINLSEHNRWYDNENNWISIYVQDGELKILNMSIVKGD